ncbi:unnamed protein product [Zymoseptoria tritici ST99CH_1A5]|uniref:Uncharacterized protein n=1 Tax=Zymoseptoria tritici ST99CH_1A5 TaxID=1276529 RepID=A0A1Y6L5W3_ZYMTR|nr:unnamed protein product [Zymoseptoria tritici ST99CH_3D1]SMY19836.1 unnamed protein product [Zymoseptoria tritici ST99CH_1A5]
MPSNRRPRQAPHTPPTVQYSQSDTWIHPSVLHRQTIARANKAREKFCPKSELWPNDYDVIQHDAKWKIDKGNAKIQTMERASAVKQAKIRLDKATRAYGAVPVPTVEAVTPFNGKAFISAPLCSPVLCYPTIFNITFPEGRHHGHPVASWPTKEEMHEASAVHTIKRPGKKSLHLRNMPFPSCTVQEISVLGENILKKVWIPQYSLDQAHSTFAFAAMTSLAEKEVEDPATPLSAEEELEVFGPELWTMLDEFW